MPTDTSRTDLSEAPALLGACRWYQTRNGILMFRQDSGEKSPWFALYMVEPQIQHAALRTSFLSQ